MPIRLLRLHLQILIRLTQLLIRQSPYLLPERGSRRWLMPLFLTIIMPIFPRNSRLMTLQPLLKSINKSPTISTRILQIPLTILSVFYLNSGRLFGDVWDAGGFLEMVGFWGGGVGGPGFFGVEEGRLEEGGVHVLGREVGEVFVGDGGFEGGGAGGVCAFQILPIRRRHSSNPLSSQPLPLLTPRQPRQIQLQTRPPLLLILRYFQPFHSHSVCVLVLGE